MFKLYWSLEALKIFAKDLSTETLYDILDKASQEREYTVREKAAQILSIVKPLKKYDKIKARLVNDENYYVRLAIDPIK